MFKNENRGFFSVLNDRVKAGRRLWNVLWRTALISAVMEALQLFIGAFTRNDKEYIAAVMHSGYEGKFKDTLSPAQLV